jgi:hypothetical protein
MKKMKDQRPLSEAQIKRMAELEEKIKRLKAAKALMEREARHK